MNTTSIDYLQSPEAVALLAEAVAHALAALLPSQGSTSISQIAKLFRGEEVEASRLSAASQREREGEHRHSKAMSIRAFCVHNDICPATYFKLKKKGLGPREMLIGTRKLITPEAEADWRREREADAVRAPK